MAVRPEEVATTLLARARSRRERDDARGADVRARVEEVVRRALADGVVSRAWLIGSLSSGTFGEGSDVDVVVEGGSPAQVAALHDLLAAALTVQVDLLRLEDLDRQFRSRVLREGVVLGVP
jgi:predicted nucleotidyltransferase